MTQHPCCARASVSKNGAAKQRCCVSRRAYGAGQHLRSDQDMAAVPVMRSVLVVSPAVTPGVPSHCARGGAAIAHSRVDRPKLGPFVHKRRFT